MVTPEIWSPFASEDERCAQLCAWGLLQPGQKARELVYSGAYAPAPTLCALVGRVDDDVAVIDLGGARHCIFASHLAEMQKGHLRQSVPEDYVVIDLETTGLSAKTDEIIEFAGVRYHRGRETARLALLIRPRAALRPEITALTGITPEMLSDAPEFAAVFPAIRDFLGDDAIVAHNARFDVGFLKAAYAQQGAALACGMIDTLALSRAAFPGMPNYKLTTLRAQLDIRTETAHRALPDVLATAELYRRCIQALLGVEPQSAYHNQLP